MKHLISTGKLTWEPHERRTDRYGAVYLLSKGDSTTQDYEYAPIAMPPEFVGKIVRLTAEVIETRQSTHIGDLFHGVFPTTPDVGEVQTLGTGVLSMGRTSYGADTVVIDPGDRETFWMDIRALYRVHEQTVRLYAEDLS